MQAYSLDLRQRVAQALAEPGARQAQVAARFCVSLAFVGKLLRRQRHTGSLAALPGRGGPPRCLDATAQAWLVAQVGRQSDATLAELRDALAADTGQRVSVGVIWRVLDEHGLRRKKSLHATERDTQRVHELRRQ
ncbi:transposase [Hymenobacter sp. J193]|uniref:transposase n=1 Tax=Hymenobacter sp. J193 TaxID=2898429 RepID=UPI0021514755|nr:transposase [Hymenobacter sp. J193]MCR5889037.1 transposase [Hymenobacter sp. J193]